MKFTPVVLAAFAALALEVTAAPLNPRLLDGDILGGDIVSGNSLIPIASESNPTVANPKTKIDSTTVVKGDAHKHHRRLLDGDIAGGPILSGNSVLPILSESSPSVIAPKTKVDSTQIVDYSHDYKKHHRRLLDGDIAGGPILSGNSILPILSESNPSVIAPKTTIDSYVYYQGDDGKWYKSKKNDQHHRRLLDGDIAGGPILSGNSVLPILSESNPSVIAPKTKIDSTKIVDYSKDHKHHRRLADGDILGGPILSGNSILPILSESNPSVIAPKTKIDSTEIVDYSKDHKHHRRLADGDILGGPILSGNSILPILSESNPTVVAGKTDITSYSYYQGDDGNWHKGKKADHHRRLLDGDILGGPILSGNSILPILSESNPTVVAGKTNIDSTKIINGAYGQHDKHGHYRRLLDGDLLGGAILSGNSLVPILSESAPTVVDPKTTINSHTEVSGTHNYHRRLLDGDILGGPIASGNSILPILSESNPTVVAGKTNIDSTRIVTGGYDHKHHRRLADGDILGGAILSGNSLVPVLSESNPTVVDPKTTINSKTLINADKHHHRRLLDGDILGGPLLSGNSILPILSESNPSVIAPKTQINSHTEVEGYHKNDHKGKWRRLLDGDILGGPLVSGNSLIPILSESNPTVVAGKTNIDSTNIVKGADGHHHHHH